MRCSYAVRSGSASSLCAEPTGVHRINAAHCLSSTADTFPLADIKLVNDETDTQRSRPVFGWCAVLQTLFSCLPSGRPWLFCFIAAVLVYSASHSCISPSLRDATCRVDYLLGSLWHWEVSGLTLTPGACSFYNLLPLDQAACRCYTRCSWMVTLADIVICLFTYMSSCSVVLYYI